MPCGYRFDIPIVLTTEIPLFALLRYQEVALVSLAGYAICPSPLYWEYCHSIGQGDNSTCRCDDEIAWNASTVYRMGKRDKDGVLMHFCYELCVCLPASFFRTATRSSYCPQRSVCLSRRQGLRLKHLCFIQLAGSSRDKS
jgi:hypothetical protein